jgi:hypothetical protein
MRALFVLAVLVIVTAAQGQNASSEKFLAFAEVQRNAVWTELLVRSGERCDRVVRTMFQGGHAVYGDTWSVGCGDGNEYSVTISSDAEGSTRLMSCRELVTASVLMSGGKSGKRMGCWAKWN